VQAAGQGTRAEATVRIVAPDHNARIWRNPETPAPMNRLALKAAVEPAAAQVVWYVDGEPFSVAAANQAVFWPLTPGAHRFEVRLPQSGERSRPVRVTVE
jgi:penicillin-binding protein 1C